MTTRARMLSALLSDSSVAERIRNESPAALARTIASIGLEECGLLLAFASTQQIEQVLDIDVWRAQRAGFDEEFDSERFGQWIEVLVDVGVEFAFSLLPSSVSPLPIMWARKDFQVKKNGLGGRGLSIRRRSLLQAISFTTSSSC